ncbi:MULTISPECIES: TetR/AcrR family transcriptional regulator [Nocardioides]|uniref:TetR/AcrR family transcriptional regulator n=1 Tax=Nocardioides vastitatis TaxID=2568655 RepID=A0ABW0ZAZ6_9ACTN|nr:TetR/AcrR family transcriptional regulator [Nocardioides sp.]
MGRPRSHDLDLLLDHARALWVDGGAAGLTIRRLSARSGVSNGAIYNAFGSRDNLLARVWAREADAFLAFQREAVEHAGRAGTAQDAVVAAALAPATYARTDEQAARLLLAVPIGDIVNADLGPTERSLIEGQRRLLWDLIVELAERLWGRSDRSAATLVTYCLVDLPGKLLLSAAGPTDPLAVHAVEQAVRGITGVRPPTP